MAARRYSTEEVLELVLDDTELDEGSDIEEVDEENDEEKDEEELSKILSSFKTDDKGFNTSFFHQSATEVLLPLLKLSRREISYETSVNDILLSSSFPCAQVFKREAEFWLQTIHRRLAGRVRIRTPHYVEIHRAIPFELFNFVGRLVKTSTERLLCEPHCFQSKNKKCEVISLTCNQSVKRLFCLLSGKKKHDVDRFFKRTMMSGKRINHKLSVLVSDVKDFAFVYKFNKEELTISFHYSEFNSFGCPQHH